MPGLVAYNPNGILQNALQFGTIVMAVNGSVNLGSLSWCPGFGICNQYIIITDTYTNGKTSQANAQPMGFCTADLSDAALISSINKLAASKSSGPFATLSNAITWAISEGYFIINQDYPSIITDGCVLNLDAGLPASYPLVFSNWYDLSGNGNTGTLNGATYSSLSYGNLSFVSSSSNYISFASTSNIPSGNDNYTISTWFNPSSLGTKGLIGWGNYGTTNQSNSFRLSATGLVNSWGSNDLSVTTSLSTGTWYNAVATFNGTTRQIWVNGSSVGSDTPTSHNVTTTSNLTVGRTNTSEYFDGKIGEVQIFNRALSSNEIVQNYNALLPRYNGTYVDPCNAPPYCTPQSTPTPTVTPTHTPTPPPASPTPTHTPTPTPKTVYTYILGFSTVSAVTACLNYSISPVTYYSYDSTLDVGMILYTTINGNSLSGLVITGYYSNGSIYGVVTGNNGVIISGSTCPTPTPTHTPTMTPGLTSLCLGYSATDCASACSDTCTTYYSNCSTLIVGCSLYSDAYGTIAPDGYYSDGINCYHLVTPPVSPTPTSTPPSTPNVTPTPPPIIVEFTFHDDGAGVIRLKSKVISGITLDSLSWSGNARGWESLGCVGTSHDQTFSDVLGAGNTEISTEIWGSISSILSAKTLSLTVGGTVITSSSQTITVGGHSYLIVGAGICNSPLI